MFLCALGRQPTLLLNTMESQLEAVRQDIHRAEDEIVETKQDLARAIRAGNKEKERLLFELLLNLNNQLRGLQEKKSILRSCRSQAPGKPCLQLVYTLKTLKTLKMAYLRSHHVAVHFRE